MPDSTPWTTLHAQLHQILRSRQLLPKAQRLLVAVSGGQDSLCLIQLLLDLQPKWQWELAIAHCDHGWRTDSKKNADYIQQLAKHWQIPYYQLTASGIAKTEASARKWRYQVLAEVAENHQYSYVVTGHTNSDRAETLLYNLVRGSGADGLQALSWQRPLQIQGKTVATLVRPLLEITRSQTGEFCHTRQLKIWEDSTNNDLNYARNRIRKELLPYLQTHFNPQVEKALAQTVELLQADVDYLEQQTTQLYQQTVSVQPIKINRIILRSVPLALQRRVIRRVLIQVLPKAPNFDQIEKLTALISAPNRSQTDPFPGGILGYVEGDWILFNKS
ncbi:MAG: tRNA lysidine(34) synthetase TilS [Microcoleaceae cyanobacterium]